MRWRRFRKWAKWACTGAAGASAGLAALSAFFYLDVTFRTKDRAMRLTACATQGVFAVDWDGSISDWHIPREWDGFFYRRPGWSWGADKEYGWRAGLQFVRDGTGPASACMVGASSVHPILLFALPAALLWYADRRFGPGRCAECGYSRRGLAESAKCPECGTTPTPTRG